MARRSVWLVTGVVAGAASTLYAERKVRQTLEAASSRLQPDALAVEVGRTARQAASSTGERLRGAMATARQEKRRREAELWTELSKSEWQRSLGAHAVIVTDAASDGTEDASEQTTDPGRGHLSTRRMRRFRRNTPISRNAPFPRNNPSYLGK